MLNSLDYGYLIGPRIQIVDADGKPMTGAWLRVFIAGTTTDANTYSDWEGTVQPVKKILDARGETTIIAAVSGAYKVMLCDSTHPVSSPYWYADNVVLTNVNELDVVPIVVDAEVGKLTVTVVTDALGIKHYVVGIDPAYSAERDAYADGKVADEAARAKAAEAAETERALAAEAAATTVVAAGTNVQVNSATAGDGHKTYTVSTGQNKYSLFVNAAGTSNYYAKVATCDPYDALGASYGWINGSFIATEFNGAITIFAMNVERAVNGQAYSGDMNAYFEGRNLSTFSYANTSNIEEIRLYEGATPRTVEIWVKLKTGYKNCSTAFAVLENDANDGNPRGNNPWTLVANPALVNTWPSDMTNRLSLTHTDNQVKSLAYLDTQIAPGDNITISETTDANGKHKYTITGNAPNVSVTSTDGSLDISETSTPTSKTIDLSVKSRISNFIGNFTSAELPTESGIYLQMSKSSGTLLNSSSAITVPAGTYHISLMLQADCAAYQQNVNDNGIIVYDTGVLNTFYFHTDPSSGLTQSFTIAYDRTFSASTQLQFFGKADLAGWTLSGKVWIHAVANATTGGTGGGLSAVVHDATLTGDGTAASPLSVVGGGDSRGIPPTMDSEGYYHIYTLAQMLWVNNSLANLPEKNYKLMNDIVCNSDYSDYFSWETTPPMNEMLATNGGCIQANYFDGNGHTIYGMYSYNVSAYDAAFFGTWDSSTRPTIKNVRLKNCTAIGNTTAEAIITNGTYSNICVESSLFKNLSKQAWRGSTIIESPSYYGASIVSNVYSINCTLKGGNAYYHSGLFIGCVASDGSSANSKFFNCYENQTESIVDSFAGSFAYPVNGKNLYKQSGASWNSSGTFNLTDCAEKSTAEIKSQAFCDLLNSNASASSYPATWSYSEGMFPYLYNWTQE